MNIKLRTDFIDATPLASDELPYHPLFYIATKVDNINKLYDGYNNEEAASLLLDEFETLYPGYLLNRYESNQDVTSTLNKLTKCESKLAHPLANILLATICRAMVYTDHYFDIHSRCGNSACLFPADEENLKIVLNCVNQLLSFFGYKNIKRIVKEGEFPKKYSYYFARKIDGYFNKDELVLVVSQYYQGNKINVFHATYSIGMYLLARKLYDHYSDFNISKEWIEQYKNIEGLAVILEECCHKIFELLSIEE